MSWRLAKSLEELRRQVNNRWPNRGKQSDGTKGDDRHAATKSEHNPNAAGVVTAMDITHDPLHGFDSYKFAQHLLDTRDPRVWYVISNGRIGSVSAGPSIGKWRKYTGSNKHDHHVHISVMQDARLYDNPAAWNIDGVTDSPPTAIYVPPPPTLRKGDNGTQVQTLQGRLNANGASLKVDGDFGLITERALRAYQTAHGLVVDGICGPQCWAALK